MLDIAQSLEQTAQTMGLYAVTVNKRTSVKLFYARSEYEAIALAHEQLRNGAIGTRVIDPNGTLIEQQGEWS